MEPLLNHETLENLLALSGPGEDADFLEATLDLFRDSMKESMVHLRAAQETGDYAQLHAQAHKAKGMSLNVGAERLAGHLMELEALAKQKGNWAAVEDLLSETETTYARTLSAYGQWLAEHTEPYSAPSTAH